MGSRSRSSSSPDRLRTLRLTLAYDGTAYRGWQRQPGEPTIQGQLIDACARVLGEPVRVVGASRTDAGVHAFRQVASLRTGSALLEPVVHRALNAVLPREIRILDVAPAPADFDARRSARGKRYAYLLDRSSVGDPFLLRYAWRPPGRLDVAAMGKALACLRGTHDFSAFCAAAGRDRTPTCTIRSARLVARGRRLGVCLSADSFLHHMVRNIVGSLVEVGRGARPPGWVAEVLDGRDRTRAGPTAPARGLTLIRVLY
jgi:tRNA pseudouridine38-40 synthase